MDKPTIVITRRFHPEVIDGELAPVAEVVHAKTREELEAALPRADGLITLLSDKVDAPLLDRGERLRVVGNYAVGYDNIDIEACRARGIAVVNTPGVLTRATAELALTLLMAAARRVPEGEAICRSGDFHGWEPDMLLGKQMLGRRAVIVGGGRIGSETARLFEGIGMDVTILDVQHRPEAVDAALRDAQVISMHVPLTPETHHWLGRERIAALREDCIVINTARGPVVDEEALTEDLRDRRIFAAGFDVYEREPAIPEALRALPNVVLLPHLGSATETSRRDMARIAVQGVLQALAGKRPENLVE